MEFQIHVQWRKTVREFTFLNANHVLFGIEDSSEKNRARKPLSANMSSPTIAKKSGVICCVDDMFLGAVTESVDIMWFDNDHDKNKYNNM